MHGKIYHRTDDGDETDVTEGVQVLYDLVIASMDFRSGFLTYEDALPVVILAELCDFAEREAIEGYVQDLIYAKAQQAFLNAVVPVVEKIVGRKIYGSQLSGLPHEHVFETSGRCVWPGCYAREDQKSEGTGI